MKQKRIAFLLRTVVACALSGSMLLGGFAMLGAVTPVVHAQTTVPIVNFNGASQTFTFQNVTTNVDAAGETVPDLFPSLKSIVPGDSITQNITLSVRQIPSNQQVTIYLQAQSENDDYNTLLESATLQVVHEGEDVTQSLAEPVALGVFDSAQTEETAVTLTVPISVGNEISGLSANIDWVFSAEYESEPTPTSTPTPGGGVTTPNDQDSPKTGDVIFLWVCVVLGIWIICAVLFAVCYLISKFKSK